MKELRYPVPTTPIQLAWAEFEKQFDGKLHGPTDAFKWAWKAATENEREACAKLCLDAPATTLPAMLALQIHARGQA